MLFIVEGASPMILSHVCLCKVATVGPASNTIEILEKLFLAGFPASFSPPTWHFPNLCLSFSCTQGVDVFRLNFSHGAHEEKAKLVTMIRTLEAKHGRAIAILADLQGPKHRVGSFPDGAKVDHTSY